MTRYFTFWEHRGFCFDDVDPESACLPYEKARLDFYAVALTDVRELRLLGAVVDIPHAEDPERDPRDSFHQRLFYLDRPAPARGWKHWVAAATALPRVLSRLLRFLESRPGFRRSAALSVRINGTLAGRLGGFTDPRLFELRCPLEASGSNLEIELKLSPCWGDLAAWLGKMFASWPLPRPLWVRLQKHRYRYFQHRRLRVRAVEFGGREGLGLRFDGRSVSLERAAMGDLWRLGINLVGYFDHRTGIGESVRCAARAAAAAEIPVSLIQLKCTPLARSRDTEFADRLVKTNPHRVNVFHILANEGREVDRTLGPGFRKEKYNIAYWAWELEEFPSSWAEQHRYFDEIWAPSRFAAEAIAAKLPLPTLVMPHAVEFPIPQGDFRGRFGLPDGLFLFLFAFDLNSQSARKNPEAVVRAFLKAFPEKSAPAGLVIKTHGAEAKGEDFARLQAIVAETPRCFLISQSLSRAEVQQLQVSCDGFVSLHRSEGFGLSVAEMMYLGKPVVSTDWSATAEFVTAQNGCPVEAELVTLERNHDVFPKGSVWAEPSVDHAAAYMRRLVREPGWGARLGAQAAADIRRRFSARAVGERYRRRIETLLWW